MVGVKERGRMRKKAFRLRQHAKRIRVKHRNIVSAEGI
jgi:hypothetical protein